MCTSAGRQSTKPHKTTVFVVKSLGDGVKGDTVFSTASLRPCLAIKAAIGVAVDKSQSMEFHDVPIALSGNFAIAVGVTMEFHDLSCPFQHHSCV